MLLSGPVAGAQTGATDGMRPVAQATWTERAPKIDGVLDEAVWQTAEPLSALTQVEPVEGVPPSRPTEIRILTDSQNLYIGVRAWDPDPGTIIARSMQRDADLVKEDRFGFILDPFHDRRNGYFFQTNPLGARLDGLIEAARLSFEWDGIWNVKTRIDSQGWQAEFVIPFKTLNFRPGADVWGFNTFRGIRGAEENTRWAEPYQNLSTIDPGAAGTLRGMARARQGLGIDVVPSMSIARVDDARELEDENNERHYTRFQPSGDVRWKITPSLTATGTANTAFGQTPADDVQVNLGRSRLFFPEKRDFFLQDEGIFDFGNIEVDAQPFFSRRIGLSVDGDQVPIRGGGKLTGRIGPLNVGVLTVHQAAQNHEELDPAVDEDVEAKTVGVARLKLNVGEESTVGVIGTWGDPQTEDGNWLVGTDFNYRTTELFGDKVFETSLWYQRSHSYGDGATCTRNDDSERDCDQENAFGMRMAYPNDRVNWNFVLQEIQEDFRPALGFVRRDNTRRFRGNFRYRWRPEDEGTIRTLDANLFGYVLTASDRADVVQEAAVWPTFPDITTDIGDRLTPSLRATYERELEDRPVFDNVLIAKGEYQFLQGVLALEASRARPVSGRIEVSGGGYFSGYRVGVDTQLRWEPIPQLLVVLRYNHLRHWGLERTRRSASSDDPDPGIGGNSFTVRIATARVEVQLSPDLTWSNLVQYDNGSDQMSLQSRFRWTITPGSDLFLVLNQGFIAEDETLKAGRTEPLVKLAWTFRF